MELETIYLACCPPQGLGFIFPEWCHQIAVVYSLWGHLGKHFSYASTQICKLTRCKGTIINIEVFQDCRQFMSSTVHWPLCAQKVTKVRNQEVITSSWLYSFYLLRPHLSLMILHDTTYCCSTKATLACVVGSAHDSSFQPQPFYVPPLHLYVWINIWYARPGHLHICSNEMHVSCIRLSSVSSRWKWFLT